MKSLHKKVKVSHIWDFELYCRSPKTYQKWLKYLTKKAFRRNKLKIGQE